MRAASSLSTSNASFSIDVSLKGYEKYLIKFIKEKKNYIFTSIAYLLLFVYVLVYRLAEKNLYSYVKYTLFGIFFLVCLKQNIEKHFM